MHIGHEGTDENYAKLGQRGGKVVMIFLPTFRILGQLGPLHISGTVEATSNCTAFGKFGSNGNLV